MELRSGHASGLSALTDVPQKKISRNILGLACSRKLCASTYRISNSHLDLPRSSDLNEPLAKMPEEIYEGAIGIDLGTFSSEALSIVDR